MQRSPCHECKIHMVGKDKNGPECLNCRKRLEFVGALQSMTGPVPMELTDMGARRISAEVMARAEADLARCAPPEPKQLPGRWTPDQDELVRTLAPAEAAERLDKSIGSIYVRRSQLKAKRPARPPDPDYHTVALLCPHCGKGIRLQAVGS